MLFETIPRGIYTAFNLRPPRMNHSRTVETRGTVQLCIIDTKTMRKMRVRVHVVKRTETYVLLINNKVPKRANHDTCLIYPSHGRSSNDGHEIGWRIIVDGTLAPNRVVILSFHPFTPNTAIIVCIFLRNTRLETHLDHEEG